MGRSEGGTPHVAYIDALKGLAIILVVIEHVANGYLEADIFPEAKAVLWGIDNVIFGFHMQLFMMLSGYCYSNAYLQNENVPAKRKIQGKICDHIIVYLSFSIVFSLVKIGLNGGSLNRGVTLQDLFLIPIKPIEIFWYICVLIIYYILFSFRALFKISRLAMLGILLVLCVCGQLIMIPWFAIGKLLFYILFFYIGILYQKRRAVFFDKPLVIWISFGIATVLYGFFWKKPFVVDNLIHYRFLASIVTGFGGTIMVWHIFRKVSFLRESRFLQMMGKYTLEIYLMHI